MRSSRMGALPTDLGDLIDTLDSHEERIGTLETPSGESLSATVERLTALISDIQAQLDAWTASRYTNEQIDTAIAEGISAAITGLLAGNVSIAGNLSAGGDLVAGGKVTMPGVYALNVTGAGRPRTTVWVDAAGEVGHT
jgi:hypothetical protein